MLPDFLIIGAARCGTTSLYEYLRAHPRVFMPDTKELNFFVEEENWGRGLDWYRAQFADARAGQVAGEASPHYTMHPLFAGVPERIATVLPNVRLIYLVRHPIERIYSHYLHHRAHGSLMPWNEDVLSNPRFLSSSRYAHQIEVFLEWFAREQLLVVRSEDLRQDRGGVLRGIFRFLDVDEDWTGATHRREFNTSGEARRPFGWAETIRDTPGYRRLKGFIPGPLRRAARRLLSKPITAELGEHSGYIERRLVEMLREDVRRLRPYMGDDFDGWGIA